MTLLFYLGQPYTEQDIKLGHVLLVFISCCMAGRAYPVGEIDTDLKVKVKHQIFTCLTCLHSKRAAEDEPPYPYLRTLLEFNTQELLNVLSLAFEESEFSGELGARRQQRVIDILIEIMIDSAQFSVIFLTFLKRTHPDSINLFELCSQIKSVHFSLSLPDISAAIGRSPSTWIGHCSSSSWNSSVVNPLRKFGYEV